MLRANYHTHTTFCDGSSTPEEVVREALKRGLTHLGFSGHVDIDPLMDVAAYQAEIRRLQEEYADRIRIFCGGELDNMYEDRQPEGFDYLIGSVHHMKAGDEILAVDWTEDQVLRLLQFYGGGLKLCKAYFQLLTETYGKGSCAWIGHFDLVTRFNEKLHFVDENDAEYLSAAYHAMECLVNAGLPLEINTKQSSRGKLFPSSTLLRRLHELGGEIVISSDAHHASDLTKGFDLAVQTAKSCGFDHTNILISEGGRIKLVPIGFDGPGK